MVHNSSSSTKEWSQEDKWFLGLHRKRQSLSCCSPCPQPWGKGWWEKSDSILKRQSWRGKQPRNKMTCCYQRLSTKWVTSVFSIPNHGLAQCYNDQFKVLSFGKDKHNLAFYIQIIPSWELSTFNINPLILYYLGVFFIVVIVNLWVKETHFTAYMC